MRLSAIIFMAAFTITAHVHAKTLMWSAPTQRQDSTNLPQNEIDHYNVYADSIKIGETTLTSYNISAAREKHTYTVSCVDIYSVDSGASNGVTIDPVLSAPNAPVITLESR